ncbi:MAG: hypothetical protein AAF799_19885 [Myxococcota bacterium]
MPLALLLLALPLGCTNADAHDGPGHDAEAPLVAAPAKARGPGGPGGPGGERGRAKAKEACQGKDAGAACQITTPRGTHDGTCRDNPHGDRLCVTPQMEERRKKPAEACSGKNDGDTCTMNFRGREVAGQCKAGPDGGALMCRPERRGRPQPPA